MSSVMRALTPGASAAEAFGRALTDEGAQQRGHWVAITVDVKAVEEVHWQAIEILRSLKVPEEWPEAAPVGSGATERYLYALVAGWQRVNISCYTSTPKATGTWQ